jgi:tRNA(Ile)-lysidine synthase
LQTARAEAWDLLLESENSASITFKLEAWRALPLALQRALLRHAIAQLRPTLRNINFAHIDNAVEQLQHARTGAHIGLPKNLMLTVDYGTVTLSARDQRPDLPDWPLLPEGVAPIVLNAPGAVRLPDSTWTLHAALIERTPDQDPHRVDRWSAWLDAAHITNPLIIRTRVTGDTFQPQGMPSPVRLTHWMINAKVPQRARERLPLIVAADQIIWVAGFRIAQPFIITPGAQRVLQLQFQK